MDSANVVATTIGILIGYFAGEVGKARDFERLFWVQRYYYAIDPLSLVRAAFLLPMGGVLHKATLEALDKLHAKGLMSLKSARGHMLGSCFFRDSGLKYGVGTGSEVEEARNGFLVSILECCSRQYGATEKGRGNTIRSRSIQSLCILKLSYHKINPKKPPRRTIVLSPETSATSIRPLLSIFASECVAIGLGLWVAIYVRSWFSIFWFAPFTVKVLSTLFSVRRESLNLQYTAEELSKFTTLHIHHPVDGFMIIRGPSKILQQFYQHYGHPKRNKPREMMQLFLILVLDLLYPAGLICLSWMPGILQYVWLGYQLFVALAMHAYCFLGGDLCCSMQEAIGKGLLENLGDEVCLGREGKYILTAQLKIESVESVRQGLTEMASLVREFAEDDDPV
jgi:hypothetical protein